MVDLILSFNADVRETNSNQILFQSPRKNFKQYKSYMLTKVQKINKIELYWTKEIQYIFFSSNKIRNVTVFLLWCHSTSTSNQSSCNKVNIGKINQRKLEKNYRRCLTNFNIWTYFIIYINNLTILLDENLLTKSVL